MPSFNDQKNGEKKLSIIIVNYRSEQSLKRCIASIYNYLNFDFEIIVVNNDSREKLQNIIKEFSEVKIIQNERNLGFGKAVNLGAEKAEGSYLFLLNPDARLVDGKLRDALEISRRNEKIAVIGPRIINKEGQTQEWICGFETSFLDLIRNNLGASRSRKIWNRPKKIFVHWVSGVAMIIDKKIFKDLGGFDEKFFMYFEDLDLCKRIKNCGKKILYFPELEIFHESGGSAENKQQQKKYYYESQEAYFKKHFGKTKAFLVKTLRKITHV